MDSNIIPAVFGAQRTITLAPRYRYDYGQLLKITGARLPDVYEVHFANEGQTEAMRVLNDGEYVPVPDELFTTGKDILAWIYVHMDEDDGETVYKMRVPVNDRARPEDYQPTPVEIGIVEQAIAALNRSIGAQAELDGNTLILTTPGEG